MIYLDTHVVVWLYLPRLELLSDRARDAIELGSLLVSPAVALELAFLAERGRLLAHPRDVLSSLGTQLGLEQCDADFERVADAAVDQSWTRDPFDRLIVGQAAAADRPLVTKDETIRNHFAGALW